MKMISEKEKFKMDLKYGKKWCAEHEIPFTFKSMDDVYCSHCLIKKLSTEVTELRMQQQSYAFQQQSHALQNVVQNVQSQQQQQQGNFSGALGSISGIFGR